MGDRDDLDGARCFVECVDDAVRPTSGGPVTVEFEWQRLAEAPRILGDVRERFDYRGRVLLRQALDIARCGSGD